MDYSQYVIRCIGYSEKDGPSIYNLVILAFTNSLDHVMKVRHAEKEGREEYRLGDAVAADQQRNHAGPEIGISQIKRPQFWTFSAKKIPLDKTFFLA